MKKQLFILAGFLFFVAQFGFAQSRKNIIKIGPSFAVHRSQDLTDYKIHLIPGVETSFELGIGQPFSLNVASSIYYWKNKSFLNAFNVVQQDNILVLDFQADLRAYFKEKYSSPYFGIGTNFKYDANKLLSKLNTPSPLFENIQRGLGFSLGIITATKIGIINPNIYLSKNLFESIDESAFSGKIGISWVF